MGPTPVDLEVAPRDVHDVRLAGWRLHVHPLELQQRVHAEGERRTRRARRLLGVVLTRHERVLSGARATLGGAGVTHRTGMGPRRRFGARLTHRGAWVTHRTGMGPRLRLAARRRGGVSGSVCSRRLVRGGL